MMMVEKEKANELSSVNKIQQDNIRKTKEEKMLWES